MPRNSQDFEGPGMVSRVDAVLGMSLNNADDGDDITFSADNGIGNPYLQHTNDGTEKEKDNSAAAGGEKKKSSKKSKSGSEKTSSGAGGSSSNGTSSSGGASRPKSAARRRENENSSEPTSLSGSSSGRGMQSGFGRGEEEYPSAKGLVRK